MHDERHVQESTTPRLACAPVDVGCVPLDSSDEIRTRHFGTSPLPGIDLDPRHVEWACHVAETQAIHPNYGGIRC
jgi:hypothetical protein